MNGLTDIERDASAWMEDGDRMVARTAGHTTPCDWYLRPLYDTHTYESAGMSLEEQRREAYASTRGLVVMMALGCVGFLVVVIAIYVQRTGGW